VAFADLEMASTRTRRRARPRRGRWRCARPAPGLLLRVRNWVTGGASTLGIGGLGALTDWQIAALLLGFVLVLIVGGFGVALWLFGKQRVADWISRHIA
jgi:hypothetical protein